MVVREREGSTGHHDYSHSRHHHHLGKKLDTERRASHIARYDGDDERKRGFEAGKHMQNHKSASHRITNPPPPPPMVPPALTANQTRTGLVLLLDNFVANETTPAGREDVLYHARELRRLLCSEKDSSSKAAEMSRALDERRPDKGPRVAIPDYIERRVKAAADLPLLPPISEPHLHNAVFTHRSAHVNPGDPRQSQNFSLDEDYERLESIGDAYIELIAARALYHRFPHVDVPEMSAWRERLVENANLSKFSHAYDLPSRLKHKGQWDADSKGWLKVTADILEAYVAALVLADPEHGFNTAEEWLTALWAPQLLAFREKIVVDAQARNQLNKMLLIKDVRLEVREERPMTYDGNKLQQYHMGIYLTGWGYTDEWLGSGHGQNKAQASIAAAADAMERNGAALQDATLKKARMLKQRDEEVNRKKEEWLIRHEEEAKQAAGEGAPHHDDDDTQEELVAKAAADGKKRKHADRESCAEQKKREEKKKR